MRVFRTYSSLFFYQLMCSYVTLGVLYLAEMSLCVIVRAIKTVGMQITCWWAGIRKKKFRVLECTYAKVVPSLR